MDRIKFLKNFFYAKLIVFLLVYVLLVLFINLALFKTLYIPVSFLVLYVVLLSLYKKQEDIIFPIFFIVIDIFYFLLLMQYSNSFSYLLLIFLPVILFTFLVYRNFYLFVGGYLSLLFLLFFSFNFEYSNKKLILISILLTLGFIIFYFLRQYFFDIIFDDLYSKYEKKIKKAQEFANSQAVKVESLNKVLNEKLRESYLLMEISREVSGILNKYLLFDFILSKIKEAVNSKAAFYIYIDSENQKLILSNSEGLDRVEKTAIERYLQYGKGVFGNAALSGKVINYYRGSNLDKYPVFKDLNVKLSFIESLLIVPMKNVHKNEYVGLLCAINKLDDNKFSDNNEFFMKTLASQVVISLMNIEFTESLKGSLEDTMKVLGAAIESKDKYTHVLHTERVSNLAVEIAKDLGLPEEEIENIKYGALIHDIGKIAIPDYILMKKGPLTDEEFKIIKKHPIEGAKILSRSRYLKKYIPYVRDHHERWDGTGYPKGLKGDQISIGAQIVAVADVYDSIATPRPYNKDRASPKNAIKIIKEGSGTQFNPVIVESFLRVLSKKYSKFK